MEQLSLVFISNLANNVLILAFKDSIKKTVFYDCSKEPYKFGERNDIMQQVHIKFSNVEQVRQFVNSIDKIDANFDLGSGHKIVDRNGIK